MFQISRLLEYYHQLAQKEKAEKERKKYVRRRSHLMYAVSMFHIPGRRFGPVCEMLVLVVYAFSGDFPRLIWGRILALSQFKNEQKLPKMVYIIPNF